MVDHGGRRGGKPAVAVLQMPFITSEGAVTIRCNGVER